MRKKPIITIIGLMVFSFSFGQTNPKYDSIMEEAVPFIKNKDWLKAAQVYSEAFKTVGNTGFLVDKYNPSMLQERYDLARLWAMVNQPDSAFPQLFEAIQNIYICDLNFLNYLMIDTCLISLHNDKRWSEFTEKLMAIKKDLDEDIISHLDVIYNEDQDQNLRFQIEDIAARKGYDCDSVHALEKIMFAKDSVHLIYVKKILDERGWLGPDKIGIQGNTTLWLVIQHSELAVQEKYLPMMREAVKNKNAFARHLALLEDRVAIRQGKKQIYGSQIGYDSLAGTVYPLPLIDPDNVDKRRAEVGLDSLQEYLSGYDATWDSEAYKKKLPEYEAKQKK
jgi:hypothetical protein